MIVVLFVAVFVLIIVVADAIIQRVRPWLDARRPASRPGIVFLPSFAVGCALVLLWLGAGLAPAVARAVPSLHDRLHRAGGVVDHVVLTAMSQAKNEFDRSELTFRAGAQSIVTLLNASTSPHTLTILDPRTGERLFESGVLNPTPVFEGAPTSSRHVFTLSSSGTYTFRCDIHPETMRGAVTVVGERDGPTRPDGRPTWNRAELSRRIAEASHTAQPGIQLFGDYLFGLVNIVLAVVLIRLRPRDRVARLFSVAMLGTAAAYSLQGHAAIKIVPIVGAIHPDPMHPITGLAYFYALLLFPDGRLVPRFGRRAVRVAYAASLFFAAMWLLGNVNVFAPDPGLGHAVNFLKFFGIVIPLAGFAAQGYRYRKASSPEERQQSRLILWVLAPVFVVGATLMLLDQSGTVDQGLMFRVFQAVFTIIPIGLFAGIVRYRLWDIDVVVNKTIVYAALAALIGAVYVGVVVVIGQALPDAAGVWLSVLATILVTVALEPARERLQRVANRVVYGERITPYEAMAGLARRVADAPSAEEILPRAAEAVALGVGADRARVTLYPSEGNQRIASWPDQSEQERYDLDVPVLHHGQKVGMLSISREAAGAVTGADERLLRALATQAATALESVRLAAALEAQLEDISMRATELSRSRERIVQAQDEARRRLQRDIGERVERELVRIVDDLEVAPRSRAGARAMLDAVAGQANQAQESMREIARGVYPPLLTERGIAPALQAQARKLGLDVHIECDESSDEVRFAGEVESTMYFCALEVLRWLGDASGGAATARMSSGDGWLRLAVNAQSLMMPGRDDLDGLTDRLEVAGGWIRVDWEAARGTTATVAVPAQPSTPAEDQISSNRSGAKRDF